jgi:hypothetical protein
MKLSNKKNGAVNAYYYEAPHVFHAYRLNGRTISHKLKWMFNHITERRHDLKKSDLKLVVYEDAGVRMINRKSGTRLYVQKTGKRYIWLEEKTFDISIMHEDSEYNQ